MAKPFTPDPKPKDRKTGGATPPPAKSPGKKKPGTMPKETGKPFPGSF